MERKSNCNIFPDMCGNPLAKTTCIFLPVCKIVFNDTLFFIRDSLQAVLFLVPKTVSESCITNDICPVECTEGLSYHIHVDTKHAWLLQSGAVVQNA